MMEAVVVNLRMILWGFYLVKLLVTRGVHFWLYRMYTCTRNQVNQLHEGSVARGTSNTFFLGNMDTSIGEGVFIARVVLRVWRCPA